MAAHNALFAGWRCWSAGAGRHRGPRRDGAHGERQQAAHCCTPRASGPRWCPARQGLPCELAHLNQPILRSVISQRAGCDADHGACRRCEGRAGASAAPTLVFLAAARRSRRPPPCAGVVCGCRGGGGPGEEHAGAQGHGQDPAGGGVGALCDVRGAGGRRRRHRTCARRQRVEGVPAPCKGHRSDAGTG